MAGIWDRVVVDGSETQNRINITLLETELTAVGLGARTRAQARAHIEAELGETLNQAELDDLNLMADQIETGGTLPRLIYSHKLAFALNAAELVLIDEATFRSVLEL